MLGVLRSWPLLVSVLACAVAVYAFNKQYSLFGCAWILFGLSLAVYGLQCASFFYRNRDRYFAPS